MSAINPINFRITLSFGTIDSARTSYPRFQFDRLLAHQGSLLVVRRRLFASGWQNRERDPILAEVDACVEELRVLREVPHLDDLVFVVWSLLICVEPKAESM